MAWGIVHEIRDFLNITAMVAGEGLEPALLSKLDFESSAFTSSASSGMYHKLKTLPQFALVFAQLCKSLQ
jgi:hypothetical protein